jgi:hypothetical protein
MASSKRKGTPGFSAQFKPAVVLSAMPLTEFSSTYYLTLAKETYTPSGTPVLHLTDEPDLSDGNPVTNMITRYPLLKPSFREVQVSGKKPMQAALIEFDPGSYGIGVMMTQHVDGETYVNIRYMPYARLADIVKPDKEGVLMAYLPETDIAKLNVTVIPSSTDEPLYSTHKVEVLFENATQAQVAQITKKLELAAAGIVAYLSKDLMTSVGMWPEADAELFADAVRCTPLARQTISTVLLGCSLVCTFVAGGMAIGYNTADKDDQQGFAIAAEVAGFSAGVLGAVGSIVANYVNGIEGGPRDANENQSNAAEQNA